MHRLGLLARWLVLALVLAPLARAEDVKSQVEDAAARAYELVNKGQFSEAVALYQKAYELAPTAALLFNIATIYDKKLQDHDRAADYYRRYIKADDADGQLIKKATLRLEAFKAESDNGLVRPTIVSPVTTTADAPGAGPLPVWKWVSLGAGVAVAGAGGVVLALGLNDYATVTKAPGYSTPDAIIQLTRAQALKAIADGTTKKTIGIVMLGVGGALVATSVVLFAMGGSQSGVRASFILTPNGGAVMAQGSF